MLRRAVAPIRSGYGWLRDPIKREHVGLLCLCPECIRVYPARRKVLIRIRERLRACMRRGERGEPENESTSSWVVVK